MLNTQIILPGPTYFYSGEPGACYPDKCFLTRPSNPFTAVNKGMFTRYMQTYTFISCYLEPPISTTNAV